MELQAPELLETPELYVRNLFDFASLWGTLYEEQQQKKPSTLVTKTIIYVSASPPQCQAEDIKHPIP